MREKIIYAFAAFAAVVLTYNLYNIFMVLGDEKNQGAIYRIAYMHIPAAVVAALACLIGMLASVAYLVFKDAKYDTLAASVTEVGLAFGCINLITGMIWARIIWGVWWAWDARLTSMLISLLIYFGYIMLRRAIDEPTQRARSSAVLSIFGFVGAVITYKSIDWWRTQHPGPVFEFRGGGGFAPGFLNALLLNMLALTLVGTILLLIRMRQEQTSRELDSLRRQAHAI